jgi:hypothetical protein
MTIPSPSATVWNVVALDYDLPLGNTPPNGQVTTIHWTATLTEVVASGVEPKVASCYGTVGLGAPDPGSYIPYATITDAQSIEWVKAALGEEEVSKIESALVSQLIELVTPEHATGTPWSSVEEVRSEDSHSTDNTSEDAE